MATMSAVAGFAPVASSPRAFHRRAGRRPNLPHAAAASREPPSSPTNGKSTTDPEKSNNVVGRESSVATLAVEEVRAWCLRTDGGVLATEADVAALRAEFERLARNAENRDRSVLELAYDAGFNSKASFYRLFRRTHGTTPTAFLNEVNP